MSNFILKILPFNTKIKHFSFNEKKILATPIKTINTQIIAIDPYILQPTRNKKFIQITNSIQILVSNQITSHQTVNSLLRALTIPTESPNRQNKLLRFRMLCHKVKSLLSPPRIFPFSIFAEIPICSAFVCCPVIILYLLLQPASTFCDSVL